MLNPLVACHTLVAEGFDFVFKLLIMRCAVCHFDNRLNCLTSVFVRNTYNRTFKHIRILHKNIFNFKRTYSEASCFDKVIGSADIPEISVLVLICRVARVIYTVSPHLFIKIFVVIICDENSVLFSVLWREYNNFAYFTLLNLVAFIVNNSYIIKRSRLAH